MAAPKAKKAAPMDSWQNKLASSLKNLSYNNPVYSARLNGPVPSYLARNFRDPWGGDAALGAQILSFRLPLAGLLHKVAREKPWQNLAAMPLAAEEFHGFYWLKHLHAAGGDAARQLGREWMHAWAEEFSEWCEKAWTPKILADRIYMWLTQYAFFTLSGDEQFQKSFFQSLMRQLRHLLRIYPKLEDSKDRVKILKALLYAAHALPDSPVDAEAVTLELEDAINQQILSDGIHMGRCPGQQAHILRDLLEIRALFTQMNLKLPPNLASSIPAIARGLRFMRHGDGGLAVFYDAFEEQAGNLDVMLSAANIKGRSPDFLEESGWYRMQAGRSLVIFDAGQAQTGDTPHPPLSFEMSLARERIIVNCGSGLSKGGAWENACKMAAARSTLDILSVEPRQLPARITSQRKAANGYHWLEAKAEWVDQDSTLSHTRRIYINQQGDDLRGEDCLERSQGGIREILPFCLRFHLHPKVQASQAQQSVLLRLPSGAGFRLRASGGQLALEKSVYLGQKGLVQKTLQIVVYGELLHSSGQIQWSMQKESKK